MKLVENTFLEKSRNYISSLAKKRSTKETKETMNPAETLKRSATEEGLKNVNSLLMSLVGMFLVKKLSFTTKIGEIFLILKYYVLIT